MENYKEKTGYASIDKPWLKYYSDEAINTPIPQLTMFQYLKQCVYNNIDKPAIDYYGKKYTYQEMLERIENAAKAFAAMGVKKGDIVSLCVLTIPETVFSIYALNRIGAICNLIEPRTNPERIKERIVAAKSNVLVVVDVFLSKIMDIENEIKLKNVIVIPISESMPFFYKQFFKVTKGRKLPKINDKIYMLWSAFISLGKEIELKDIEYEKDMPAAIIYTGGTTGIPKGAVLSNESFTAMAIQAQYDAPTLFTGSRFLEIMPPFIAYGLVFGFFVPFCAGLENHLIPVFKPENFADLVLKKRPNHVVGVPSFFESLANSKKLGTKKIDYLVSSITGGDRLLESTEEYINNIYKEHNCKYHILKGYGMTEMGSAATYTSTPECNIPGSVGIPTHYTTVKVINSETGEELKYYEQGELCMTGPTMMLGYFNNEEETNKAIRKHPDGKMWVHTGDIGYITEDGIIYIVDRIKRMIIRPDGHNVWPSQIEEVIIKHPSVCDCAVVGMKPNFNENGRIPTAFIVVNQGIDKNEKLLEEIDMFSKQYLPERDVAMSYHFCDKLPLTLVGKVDYRALENQ